MIEAQPAPPPPPARRGTLRRAAAALRNVFVRVLLFVATQFSQPVLFLAARSEMGTGASTSAVGPPGAMLKRSGFPDGVTDAESSGCEPCEGLLSKQARRGLFQQRYFKLNNNFLLYWSGKTPAGLPAASVNLALVRGAPRRRSQLCRCSRAKAAVARS